jgi:hypothetical protein
MGRSTLLQLAYHSIRFSPVIAFLLFGTFQRWITAEEMSAPFAALLICIASLFVWGMAEGTVLLWHKARIAREPEHQRRSRGYLIVTFLIALLLLPLLYLFREKVTQPLFVALLVALSFRGLSKTAWDQHKGALAAGATFLSSFILAALSFAIFRQTKEIPVTWQALLISTALASSVLALELVWNAHASKNLGKRETPLFRIALFSGPVIVGTLAFIGELPLCYAGVYLIIPLCQRATQPSTSRGNLDTADVPKTTAALCAFLLLLAACRAFENGWLR